MLGGDPLLLLFYAVTLFFSSVLLFVVEPMIGKMILPILGGTPAVWNTCMLFFQAALLAGYAYAHVTTTWLGIRRQAVAHIALLLLPLLVLPIAVVAGTRPPTGDNPVFWLLWRLLASVGLPFFVVSASAPLLQRWFASTGHPASGDPYFLYSASNFGSLLALLAYPVLIEPMLSLTSQSRAWGIGYALLVLMIGICAVMVWRSPLSRGASSIGGRSVRPDRGAEEAGLVRRGGPRPCPTTTTTTTTTTASRVRWVLLAFVPSSLMLGVTSHITTNLAAVPLLWVIPLALYLLTFALVFARRPPLSHALVVRMLPFLVLLAGPFFFVSVPGMEWQSILLHLAMFFVAAMACHGQLAQDRPDTRYLTEYYLWISIGGVLGGVFNAIVAPMVFATVAEYPLAMVGACLLQRPAGSAVARRVDRWLDLGWPLGLGVLEIGLLLALRTTAWNGTWAGLAMVFAVTVAACLFVRKRPIRFGLGYAVALLAFAMYARLGEGSLLRVERNFYGVKRVVSRSNGDVHILYHGTTLHGIQQTDPAHAREPLAYYHRNGPVGDVFSALHHKSAPANVAVVGLGAGAMACYAEPGQHFMFYEIDPAVARIARDPRYFTFLSDCCGTYDVILGDGRLTLARAPDRKYGLIFLDAYSSDAIPTHLLSREALRLYLSKLADGGMLAFHITNRFLNLEALLAALARDAGLVCLSRAQSEAECGDAQNPTGELPAQVLVMARSPRDLGDLVTNRRWSTPRADPNASAWTDQYSNILGIVRWQ
jgi:hypothetical protein